MTPSTSGSRRTFLKATATSALAGVMLPQVHAAEDQAIKIALVGCGGRGGGAAENALRATGGPTKLVAMADVAEKRLKSSYDSLKKTDQIAGQIQVPEDCKFIGFDGYRKAMDVLKKGDIVILTTPPAFRWPMYTYAIEKGLNVFMEKPVCVDAPSARRMLELNKKAKEKNLKVAVGLMCRHCVVRKELFDRIKNGEMGDINLLRAYRCKGREATCFTEPPHPFSKETSELLFQIKNFHSFLWLSGGSFSDFLIHNIDECCWMKDAWPVAAKGYGGRHYRGNFIDQNFDVYDVEYTFADGAKLMLKGRTMPGCSQEFASYAQGSKGSAIISFSSHSPAKSRIFKTQNITMRSGADVVWQGPKEEPDPYQVEWDDYMTAIRADKPYNEVERGVMASAVTAMGRFACHTGQDVALESFMKHEEEFAPGVDKLSLVGPSPLQADTNGKYPVPEPGRKKTREY